MHQPTSTCISQNLNIVFSISFASSCTKKTNVLSPKLTVRLWKLGRNLKGSRMVFQSPIFRCYVMLVSGMVFLPLNPQTLWEKWKILIPRNMGETCIYRCFLKWWYPQIIDFNRVFHYKPSILGENPYFWFNTHISFHLGILTACRRSFWPHLLDSSLDSGIARLKTQVENDQLLRMYCNSKTCVYITYIYMYTYIYIFNIYSMYI